MSGTDALVAALSVLANAAIIGLLFRTGRSRLTQADVRKIVRDELDRSRRQQATVIESPFRVRETGKVRNPRDTNAYRGMLR